MASKCVSPENNETMTYNDLFSPTKIKNLFNQYHILPKKSLGQHFLIDRNSTEKIVTVVRTGKEDTIIEIGAGLGALTVPLAKVCPKLIAYEIDRRLLPILGEVTRDDKNVEIRNEDARRIKSQELRVKNFSIVGNLPYYLTSFLLKHFLTLEYKPKRIIVTIQKEVAQRICSIPPAMSLLAVSVQVYGKPKIHRYISKGSFWPPPTVDSALLEIKLYDKPFLNSSEEESFFKLVKVGFGSRRKVLLGNVRGVFGGESAWWEQIFTNVGLDTKIRAEALDIHQWHKLFAALIVIYVL